MHWWEQICIQYGAVSPAQVFDLYKQALNFCLDGSKHPGPQLDALETIYRELATNQVNVLDFLRAMHLLACLPPSWESTIIQMVMAGGQIPGVTWQLTRDTILRYWDADQAKKAGHHPS